MTVNDSSRDSTASATAAAPRQRTPFARAALLAGGAATGLAASALAGFGLVGLMFPNAGLPGTGGAPMTAAAYSPVTVSVMPTTEVTRAAPTPAAYAPVPVAPLAPLEPVETVALAPEAPAPLAPATRDPRRLSAHDVPAEVAPAEEVVATKSVANLPVEPEIDTARFGPRRAMVQDFNGASVTTEFGPRRAALPAEPMHPTTPADEPQDFAMLAEDDAAARAGAGLFEDPPVAAETAANDTAIDSPDAASIRPARRPDGFAEQIVMAVAPTETSAAPIRSIRPAPRPAIILAAATKPAATPEAVPEIAAPTAVVEVAARQQGNGIFSGGSANCGRSLARAMPSRRSGPTGSAFFAGLANSSGPDRDAQAIAQLARGNMPSFLRNLKPVTFQGQDNRGQAVEITICVTPDYLALGSDKDFVRVPLGLPAAAKIAGAFNMTLPTPRMVDAIYTQAAVKLSPAPMTPGAQMSSTGYFVTHNATIQGQLQGRNGALTAGHKKDVVMASRMASAPGRVAIYGWHRSNGAPIQPVSTVHGANYADYSHGIRLVSKTAYLNGKAVSLDELLASSRYAHLLNTGGPMPGPVIRVASN